MYALAFCDHELEPSLIGNADMLHRGGKDTRSRADSRADVQGNEDEPRQSRNHKWNQQADQIEVEVLVVPATLVDGEDENTYYNMGVAPLRLVRLVRYSQRLTGPVLDCPR